MCANEYAYVGKLCAQMNHILSKMCANVLPPTVPIGQVHRGYSNLSVEYGFYFTSEVKNIYAYFHFTREIKAIPYSTETFEFSFYYIQCLVKYCNTGNNFGTKMFFAV